MSFILKNYFIINNNKQTEIKIVFKNKWTKITFLHQTSLLVAFKNKDLNSIYKEETLFFTDLNLIMTNQKNPLKKCGN
jgi:hypothetical protein